MEDPNITELQKKAELFEAQYTSIKKEFKDFIETTRKNDELKKKDFQADHARKMLVLADSLCRMTVACTNNSCGEINRVHENYRLNLDGLYTQLLSSCGLTPINPAPGTSFDDSLQMAIGLEYYSKYPENTIYSVIRRGYIRDNIIIRPAEVIISKRPCDPTPAPKTGFWSSLKDRVFSSQKRFESLDSQIDQIAHTRSEEVLRLEKEIQTLKESLTRNEEENTDLNLIITEQTDILEELEKETAELKRGLTLLTKKIADMETKDTEDDFEFTPDDTDSQR